jgi:hypothetical protein
VANSRDQLIGRQSLESKVAIPRWYKIAQSTLWRYTGSPWKKGVLWLNKFIRVTNWLYHISEADSTQLHIEVLRSPSAKPKT